ncbi:MAG: 23S rRNA (pseudouridine(1915)-N(3))-methyltransferase RlmH [Rickettsiales bacterium]|nr:MAG: 23S rRNA (pseudouridine(1915)-N(3))-methyltransferase RlmH [Rickettsiales bacterium]
MISFMKIQIISVGKMSAELATLAKHYQKMIGWEVRSVELVHSKKLKDEQIKQYEAKLIKEKLTKNAHIVALDLSGKHLTSHEFSKLFSSQMMRGGDIDFIIGGAFGLDESIISEASARLCLSKMTFPHQIAKLILLEQIYRAQTILNGHPYHK